MDENQVTTTADSGPAWWENTIDFVVRAAAAKRFATPQLQNGQTYYVDAAGNVVPTGYPVPGQAQVNPVLNNPMVMVAGLLFAGVILYKLVK
ncbi:hypothetical protein RY831_27670 [Noviherbaspirillum sp. CPCC 100848]|uniref:Uncharacterized protein n=1 Tax=Noviherbaspirillum album TaxID=3080276 RepID=A0ABU6JHP2_9BURK|nr:hypothetical protein [Noviherbaspirillum sp. CPCC 100848]MEC4722943.1 hypothetical protein [Noviherbaspirillum sp. CPCC 100848]